MNNKDDELADEGLLKKVSTIIGWNEHENDEYNNICIGIADDAIKAVREHDGWVSVDEFQQEPNEGECFIVYKGRVLIAYHDHREYFLFSKYASNCYMTECISAVMPIYYPSPPTGKDNE